MVGLWMLCVLGWGLSGCYHGWPMDALRARMGFVWTLFRSAHACYHGWPMDALRERMGFEWTLSWFVHGCSPKRRKSAKGQRQQQKNGEYPVKMQSKRPFQHKTRQQTAKLRASVPKRAKSQRKQNQHNSEDEQTQRRRNAQQLEENARCRPKLGNSNNENRTKKGVRAAGQSSIELIRALHKKRQAWVVQGRVWKLLAALGIPIRIPPRHRGEGSSALGLGLIGLSGLGFLGLGFESGCPRKVHKFIP